jgi:hypothetical protein
LIDAILFHSVKAEPANMTDSDHPDHWEDLARQLGAEPPPPETSQQPTPEEPTPGDAETPEEPTPGDAETPEAADSGDTGSVSADIGVGPPDDSQYEGPARPDRSAKRERGRRQAKPPSNHWASLAGELGLEVPPEPAPAPDVQAESDSGTAADQREIPSDAAIYEAASAASSDAERTDESAAVDFPVPESQVARRTASLEFGFGIIDAEDTRDQSFIEEAEDAVSDEHEDDDESYESVAPDVESAAVPARTAMARDEEEGPAPSADADADADAEKTKRRRRRRGRRRRRQDTPDDRRDQAAEEDTGQPRRERSARAGREQSEAESPIARDGGEGVGPETDRAQKPRRPRRRPIVAMPELEHIAEMADIELAPVLLEDTPQPAGAEAEVDQHTEETAGEEPGSPERTEKAGPPADSSAQPEAGRPSHRRIPSWAEAVGLIVTANTEARARAAESAGRRRGRAKGRRPNRGKKS